MSGADEYVTTADIRGAARGRETEVLDGLSIDWRRPKTKPHITCPYHDHADNNPSWRWDMHKACAFCTCIEGSHSIFDVVMKVENISFETAKLRVAQLLRRPDLICERRARNSQGEEDVLTSKKPRNGATPGCRLADYAAAKSLPPEFLQSLGIREISYFGSPALRIPYFGEDGGESSIRFRIALEGDDRFRWKAGAKPRLYGLNRVGHARAAGYVVLVEGESDCQTLWLCGFPALGLPGAGNWNEDQAAPLLDAFDVIYLVVEPDQGGKNALRWLAKSRIRERVLLIRLNGFKDPSALYLDDPEGFAERWRAELGRAEAYHAIADREAADEADRVRAAAGDLISADILARFAADLTRAGLIGEDKNAKVLFLALTTRLFDRPVSVAVKGPSSGGKSFTVETVLKFFPPSAYFERTMMSDRALAYSDEDFHHRHLVIYEAAGMTGDIASYLIRSLLSEGRIRYELVEKTSDGLKPRLIEKQGPTGLIVTTTAARLHPENETRLLSLTVKDTPQQTAVILRALARDRGPEARIDFGRWHAFHQWLETGERLVAVPFAEALAELIPPVAVRLRRDFRLLLALIHGHALLHRACRERDDQGRIVATLDDYAAVRELVADLFAEGVDATVKAETREVIAALKALSKEEVSVTDIAKALKLDKSAASRRLADAVSHGYLVNHETRRGRPARISLGEPLPGETEILPALEKLGPLRGCVTTHQGTQHSTHCRGIDFEGPLHGCAVVPGGNPPPLSSAAPEFVEIEI
jgi:hypothetical protein